MFSETKKSFWLVIISAFLTAFLGIGILSWQYHKIAEKSEQEIHSIKETMEQNLAKDVLDKFMESRLGKRKEQAITYFTENTMEQHLKNEFALIDNFVSFEILKIEKLENTVFRFIVKIQAENENNEVVEVIIITKILDRYYADSVQIAG